MRFLCAAVLFVPAAALLVFLAASARARVVAIDAQTLVFGRQRRELGVGTWIAGLRRTQAESRSEIDFAERSSGRWKLHPIADWNDRDIGEYLKRHDLPYHPLWHEGYVSIGDTHTTRRWEPGMSEEDTRFFGLKRECGLHLVK